MNFSAAKCQILDIRASLNAVHGVFEAVRACNSTISPNVYFEKDIKAVTVTWKPMAAQKVLENTIQPCKEYVIFR